MDGTSNTSPEGEPMRGVVDNYGTLSGKPDTVPEHLRPYAEQVMKMDAVRDVPANVQQIGGARPPLKFKATALPPELQSEVYRKLDSMPKMDAEDRAKYEDKFVQEAIRGQQGRIRSMTGVGRDALPFHRELAQIAMDVRELQEKRATYQTAVDDIKDLKKATDPVTGELVAEPVYRLNEEKRRNYRDVIADIDRNIRLLVDPEGKPGIEGKKRLDKALLASAELLHQRNAMREEEAEAQKLAAEMAKRERVEKRAEVLRKMRGSSL